MRGQALPVMLGVACFSFFLLAARLEQQPRWIWGGLSLALWLLCWLVLDGGFLLVFLGQGALFLGMWAWNALRAHREERSGIRE